MMQFGQQRINCALTAFTAAPKQIKLYSHWNRPPGQRNQKIKACKLLRLNHSLREQRFIPVFIYLTLYDGAQLSINTSLLILFTVMLQPYK